RARLSVRIRPALQPLRARVLLAARGALRARRPGRWARVAAPCHAQPSAARVRAQARRTHDAVVRAARDPRAAALTRAAQALGQTERGLAASGAAAFAPRDAWFKIQCFCSGPTVPWHPIVS